MLQYLGHSEMLIAPQIISSSFFFLSKSIIVGILSYWSFSGGWQRPELPITSSASDLTTRKVDISSWTNPPLAKKS